MDGSVHVCMSNGMATRTMTAAAEWSAKVVAGKTLGYKKDCWLMHLVPGPLL